MKLTVILPSAGRGTRLNLPYPKEILRLDGVAVNISLPTVNDVPVIAPALKSPLIAILLVGTTGLLSESKTLPTYEKFADPFPDFPSVIM